MIKGKNYWKELNDECSLWSNEYYRCALAGYEIAEKETKKQLKDLKNKYKSWLKDLENIKLTKTINQEEVIKLKAKIELLNEIEKKLQKTKNPS